MRTHRNNNTENPSCFPLSIKYLLIFILTFHISFWIDIYLLSQTDAVSEPVKCLTLPVAAIALCDGSVPFDFSIQPSYNYDEDFNITSVSPAPVE